MSTRFLASSGLSALRYYLPSDPRDLNLLFVPTAADFDNEPYWIENDRHTLTRMGFNVREFDIKGLDYEKSRHILSLVDVLFLAGGNTFHLLHQLQLTGFGRAIADQEDLFYVGVSAGAVVAGPDIEPIRQFDRPELVDGLDTTEALGLVPVVVMPHYDKSSNATLYDEAMKRYERQFEFVCLNDSQAYVNVDGDSEIVKSTR